MIMNYSIVKKSQLEGANRLDAEYYQPEYLKYINDLNHFQLSTLNSLTSKIDVGFVSLMTNQFKKEGVPLLRTKNVAEFLINAENDVVHISEEFHKKLKKSQIFPGYLLLARSGSIGNVATVPENFPVANSADIILIEIKKETIAGEFLATFLNSRYGRFQIERNVSGGLQGHINLFSLEKLLVPKIDKKRQAKIKKIVLEGQSLIDDSRKMYEDAENLLLEELGLNDFKPQEDLSFVVNYVDVEKANRMDAGYFQPKYEEIFEKLSSKIKLEHLSQHFKILKSKILRYSDSGEIGVIKTKQLGREFINFDVEDKIKKELLQTEKFPILENRDVVFASMGVGSLGKTNTYYDFENKDHQFTVDSTIKIFRQLKQGKILPEVLNVYLSSWVGLEQIYQFIIGSSGIISIYENYLESLYLPILRKSVQQKIAQLVKKSHEARKKSKELLEEAKRKVEEMIEKEGEKNGSNN